MTNYYTDHYQTYKGESKVKETLKMINNIFENPKIANIIGAVGAVAPVVMMVL